MDNYKPLDKIIKTKILFIIGCIGISIALFLAPPIFSSLFTMSFLLKSQLIGLWIFSTLIFCCSLLIIIKRNKIHENFSLLFFTILILIFLELTVRFIVVLFTPEAKIKLARLANRTYPELWAYKGHPFLQFTGNPSVSMIGNKALGNLTSFNNFGFIGDDFRYEKSENVIRIAALGGSTTLRGYPKMMEDFLNKNKEEESINFDVMNFGHGFYTSAHVLINFILNVVEFSPDYLVIHSGWNDIKVRDAGENFRHDYSHALQYFHEPKILDKYPIRISILYRYLKHRLTREPDWLYIENACLIKKRPYTKFDYTKLDLSKPDELKPFRRNVETIIEFCIIKGIKVILTTQPHTTNFNNDNSYLFIAKHIDQCTQILREVYRKYQNKILFVDLDKIMTGKMNDVFEDAAHVDNTGRFYKAEQIGKTILKDIQN